MSGEEITTLGTAKRTPSGRLFSAAVRLYALLFDRSILWIAA
jgi:hypothetical protein